MDGKEIDEAYPTMDQFGQREIILKFKPAGAAQFGKVTGDNVGRLLAIVLDGQLYSAPQIKVAITGGNASITGNFSREDAENVSNALVSGSVPFSMTIQAQSDIDPTIGEATVRDGLYSGIAGAGHDLHGCLLYEERHHCEYFPAGQCHTDPRSPCRV